MPLLPVLHQKQRQSSDCLAACAAMVLAYLQVPIEYKRLLRLLRTETHGSVFNNLRYLESMGLSILTEDGSTEKLHAYLDGGLPIIAFVDTGQLTSYWPEATNHAVVVVGITNDTIYLNDPEFNIAPQAVSLAEFELAWLEKGYRYAVIRK